MLSRLHARWQIDNARIFRAPRLWGLVALLTMSPDAVAQGQVRDSTISMEAHLPAIVVTATRTEREIRNLPVPTSLISSNAIRRQGALRMSDLLEQQPGIQIVQDHGAGVQIQGLSSDYTLILIDGEPVVGRVAGTLDLDRLGVVGVDRIEIVRGPSSSLYGSEALAGVINIITRKPSEVWSANIRSRFETHGTSDAALDASTRIGSVGLRLFGNRLGSSGYDLDAMSIGQTTPRYVDYSGGGKLSFSSPSAATKFNLSVRGSLQDQWNVVAVTSSSSTQIDPADQFARRSDVGITGSISHRFSPATTLSLKGYVSRFNTRTDTNDQPSGRLTLREVFDQDYRKVEGHGTFLPGNKHVVTAAAGIVVEDVTADRIDGGHQSSLLAFAFAEHEWIPTDRLDLITSVRYDEHSDYGRNIAPKFAALLKIREDFRIRTSIGSGFKAPTFQQLYLDFTNATAGYSVFGSVDAANAIGQLDDAGLIRSYLQDINNVELSPERSWSLNAGIEREFGPRVEVRANLFRNHINNLIEAAPVAIKTNAQSVFTYFNLSAIVTQGIELEGKLRVASDLEFDASYTYLDTFDRDAVDRINEGTVFRREGQRDVRVSRSDYGGLMNRSRHHVTIGATGFLSAIGATVAARGVYRGRYGFGDLNGNLLLDHDSEYVSGYWLLNLTASRSFGSHILAQVGSRNLLNHKDPAKIPSLSGRLLFASLELTIN